MNNDKEQIKQALVLNGLRTQILDASIQLVQLIDRYRAEMKTILGQEHSAILDNRKEAFDMAVYAAIEVECEKPGEQLPPDIILDKVNRMLAGKGITDDHRP